MKRDELAPEEECERTIDRRAFVGGALSAATAGAFGLPTSLSDALGAQAATAPGFPGPYPDRVIEVSHPGSVTGRKVRREPVDAMIARGMTELTGADDAVSAWRSMFSRGDRVGVKVNPAGAPLAISNHAVVHAVVDGLKSAGVRPSDIIVFDRYLVEFRKAQYDRFLPDGVRGEAATLRNTSAQLNIAGYDPDVFCHMDFITKGVHDPKDDRARRSHLCEIVSKRIDKLVALPVLKDHGSAGVTGALKNMSHGLVNNVLRSHGGADANTCNVFIPSVCSMKQIREKAVLQIMDGLIGVYDKGPATSREKNYTWPYKSLFFATDPVAMDRIEWQIIDAKRAEMKLPPVAKTGKMGIDPRGDEGFDFRQPQHIVIAGALGLGVADLDKIEHRKIALT